MTNKKKKKKGSATRGQLALIGVLSIVLVGVIVMQLPDSSDETTTAASNCRRRPKAKRAVAAKIQNSEINIRAESREWPNYDAGMLAEFDPLEAPMWYRDAVEVQANQPAAAQVKEVVSKLELEELQKSGTNIVLIDGDKRIAAVGEQRIQVGDKIDGYQVSEITDRGVVLTKSRSR